MAIDRDPNILDPREEAAEKMAARKFRHGDLVQVHVPEQDGAPSHFEDKWEFGSDEQDGTVFARKKIGPGVYEDYRRFDKGEFYCWQSGFALGQEVRVMRFGKDGAENYMEPGWKVVGAQPDGKILVELPGTGDSTPEKLVDPKMLRSWQGVENDAENLHPKKETTGEVTPAIAEQNVGEQLAAQFVTGQKVRVLRKGATEPEEGWKVVRIYRDANPVKVTVVDESSTMDKTVAIEDLVSWQKT